MGLGFEFFFTLMTEFSNVSFDFTHETEAFEADTAHGPMGFLSP
jgi:hypothetical protein